MRKVFLVLAGLMFLATIALLFFAGVGAFDAAPRVESFEPHRWTGRALFLLSLLAIGAAALARAPGRLVGLTAAVTGLVLLQSLIAMVAGALADQSATTGNLVFGLHAINGLVTMGVARTVFNRARSLAAGRADAPAAGDGARVTGAADAGSAATPSLAAES